MNQEFKLLLLSSLLFGLASCGEPTPNASSEEEEDTITHLLEASDPNLTYSGIDDAGASYEIFVYSFADSDGDGIGDLKGIADHLDYLKELGVKNLWLTPVHPSSTYHKYNVRDYFDIDPAFGTVDDFVSLCAAAKQKGLKIFMDMVFNHSSLDNPWFKKAVEDLLDNNTGEDSYAKLYSMSLNETEVPNTKYSYTYQGQTVYYEGNFDRSMPEFNLDSDIAKAKHKEIMDFWLDKGASGFRFDGVAYYYYGNNAKCASYCGELAKMAKAKRNDVYLIAEYWLDSQAYINEIPKVGMTAFNFPTSVSSGLNSAPGAIVSGVGRRYAAAISSAVQGFLEESEGKILPSFFVSNHDQDRWGANRTAEKIKAIASLYLLTPGTPYLYYGEEIGMMGTRGAASTDANRRLPMQWYSKESQDSARTSAVSEGDYDGPQTTLGALEAIKDPSSITGHYKTLLSFRDETEAIKKGTFVNVTPADSPFVAFKIFFNGKVSYLLHNVSEEEAVVDGLGTLSGKKLDGSALNPVEGKLTVPAYSTVYLA